MGAVFVNPELDLLSNIVIEREDTYPNISNNDELQCSVDKLLSRSRYKVLVLLKIPVLLGKSNLLYSFGSVYSKLASYADFATWFVLSPLQASYAPYKFSLRQETKSQFTDNNIMLENTGKADPIEDIFLIQAGARSGCCIPFLTAQGAKVLALFAGPEEDINPDFGHLFLSLMPIAAYIEIDAIRNELHRDDILSARELECLNWVAAGKTSSEIGKITSLSEHTINHYLHVCCKKLDTVNRAQAVSKALRMGLI